MVKNNKDSSVQVTFANHNYAFNYFYSEYKNLCISLSDTHSLRDCGKQIGGFIYEFVYGIPSKAEQELYLKKLQELRKEINEDEEYNSAVKKQGVNKKKEIFFYKQYYTYLMKYYEMLSSFAEALTPTFMPHTNLQKKLLKFSNNQGFFEKFIEYKREILGTLSEFGVVKFKGNFEKFVMFYYAYRLFITDKDRLSIDKMLSLILSLFLTGEVIKILCKYHLGENYKKDRMEHLDYIFSNSMLRCNSLVNESFSNYGILPKIDKNVYLDETLI